MVEYVLLYLTIGVFVACAAHAIGAFMSRKPTVNSIASGLILWPVPVVVAACALAILLISLILDGIGFVAQLFYRRSTS